MEAAYFEKHGTTVQMSEQQLLDCDTRSQGCQGGWYDWAWNYVNGQGGIETQTDYPYTGRKGTCKYDPNDSVSNVLGCRGGPNYFCKDRGLVGCESELHKMLNDRPVAVAVDASSFQFYSSGILNCGPSHRLNHAVFAVGYRDYSTVGYHDSDGHWIIKNSWGTSWGESGYVRIKTGGFKWTYNPCGVADYPAYPIVA